MSRTVVSKEVSEAKTIVIKNPDGTEQEIDRFICMILDDINFDTNELSCGLMINGLGLKESMVLFESASEQFLENIEEQKKERSLKNKNFKKDLKELAQNLIDYIEEKEKREEQKDL